MMLQMMITTIVLVAIVATRHTYFWISGDECEKWFHGKCVNITSSEAEHKERYEYPDCYYERVGWS